MSKRKKPTKAKKRQAASLGLAESRTPYGALTPEDFDRALRKVSRRVPGSKDKPGTAP